MNFPNFEIHITEYSLMKAQFFQYLMPIPRNRNVTISVEYWVSDNDNMLHFNAWCQFDVKPVRVHVDKGEIQPAAENNDNIDNIISYLNNSWNFYYNILYYSQKMK